MKPTFLVLGASKSGTSTLHSLLGRHPDVFVTPVKEPPFFDAEYSRGLDYYWNTYFASWKGQPAAGESRVAKFYLPFVTPRVRESLPDARLIILLRDPASRAYSSWWDRWSRGRDALGFHEALMDNLRDVEGGSRFVGTEGERRWLDGLSADRHISRLRTYLDVGYYADHLTRWFAHFPREQIKIFFFDRFIREPMAVTREAWKFIGVDPTITVPEDVRAERAAVTWPAAMAFRLKKALRLQYLVPRRARHAIQHALNTVGEPPRMDERDRRWLKEHYAPHDARLADLLGQVLPWSEPR